MGFFERFSRLIRSNLNDLVSKAEDPVKILDQSLSDMQTDLVKLRQAVSIAISSQKRLQSQSEQAQSQVKAWYERAEMALKKGEDDLAREALARRKTFQETFTALNNQLFGQQGQVEMLKRSLGALEGKIAEAKTKKDMLKARAQAAKAQQQLQNAVGNIGTNSAMEAFERMEDKVQALEASNMASVELAGTDLESKFASIEGKEAIDKELDQLRKSLQGGPENVALPPAGKDLPDDRIINSTLEIEKVKVAEVEAEFEELKRSIEGN